MPVSMPVNTYCMVRPETARRERRRLAAKRERTRVVKAYAAPAGVAATVVPAALAALSTPGVQINATALLPHIEALLRGPFGTPALALGCAVSAGAAAAMRRKDTDPRAQLTTFARAAGQAGLGAPLMFHALRAAMGSGLTVNLLARGIVFGMATVLGAVAGRQAGKLTAHHLPAAHPPPGKVYSKAELRSHEKAQQEAARHGSRMGGLAAAAILGVAVMRA